MQIYGGTLKVLNNPNRMTFIDHNITLKRFSNIKSSCLDNVKPKFMIKGDAG